ncbi:jg23790 [Pararge aegeria aegeria]|uniref:Jg23790 protein n=1 Tax=Pararge aegeria aegeria TaxID=348720 RepID=A0A8S4SP30_9NEOP|nr:jg23790 [Pararge aegeria aegeria]
MALNETKMPEAAVLLNISEMIDLAIGTPEIGVVDFGMLQTVLHCLAQQLRVLGKNVELRGSVAALPVGRENQQTIAVSEYIIDTEENAPAKREELLQSYGSKTEQETILVVERRRRSESPVERQRRVESPGLTTSPTRTRSPSLPPPSQRLTSTEKLSLVTISKFNILENTVEDLRSRVYGSMPKNQEILEEVRSQTNLKAITDMWTSLNVSSRLEAAETGVAKLSSLVQDLISDTSALQDAVSRRPSAVISAVGPPTAPPPHPEPLAGGQSGSPATTEELAAINSTLSRLRGDLDNLTNSYYTALADLQAGLGSMPPPTPPPSSDGPGPPEAPRAPPESRKSEYPNQEQIERINDLEKRLKECCESIGKNDGVIHDQITSFQDQLEYLMTQVNGLTQEFSMGKLSPDLIKDLQGLMKLFQTVQEMQEQLKQVHETALQLAAEKEDRQYHMNVRFLFHTIRKAQTANVTQRNMHDWENIDKQMAQQKQPQRTRSDTGKHICNRYCGGSHTVTTPAQRVARLGHFIKQWGPDVVPLSSGLAAGDDGKVLGKMESGRAFQILAVRIRNEDASYASAVYQPRRDADPYSALWFDGKKTGCIFTNNVLDAVDFTAVVFTAVDFNAVDFTAVDFNAVDFNAVDFNAVDFNADDFTAVEITASELLTPCLQTLRLE